MNTPNHILKRTVRFSINTDRSKKGHNTTASKPSMTTLGRYYELTIAVQGTPDPQTGYLLGIQEIDALVRNHLHQLISDAIESNPHQHPTQLLPALWENASKNLAPPLHSITWHLTPYHQITMNNSTQPTGAVLIEQLYEFAAAHRLHTPHLSDQENAEFFGKCNNPSGHGHNYKLRPSIRVPLSLINQSKDIHLLIENAVNESIIDPLDHKNLNTDCPPFDQSKDGSIPSVENITTHCYNALAPKLESLGCTLEQITVWETDRTSATYPA
ncbi:MAG: 6-carboxytetrahydropterin synthase [Phycisphaerales bacterium]